MSAVFVGWHVMFVDILLWGSICSGHEPWGFRGIVWMRCNELTCCPSRAVVWLL